MIRMIEKNWKELIKPAKLTVKHNNDKKSNATIIMVLKVASLVTIGNALRRILLSSLRFCNYLNTGAGCIDFHLYQALEKI